MLSNDPYSNQNSRSSYGDNYATGYGFGGHRSRSYTSNENSSGRAKFEPSG
jgi:hypothetical protein